MPFDMNRLFQTMGGYQNFQQQFGNFAQQMGNQNPQQMVEQLLASGRMSQEQFNQLSQMANMITGRRQF
jgi:hypothetical protein